MSVARAILVVVWGGGAGDARALGQDPNAAEASTSRDVAVAASALSVSRGATPTPAAAPAPMDIMAEMAARVKKTSSEDRLAALAQLDNKGAAAGKPIEATTVPDKDKPKAAKGTAAGSTKQGAPGAPAAPAPKTAKKAADGAAAVPVTAQDLEEFSAQLMENIRKELNQFKAEMLDAIRKERRA